MADLHLGTADDPIVANPIPAPSLMYHLNHVHDQNNKCVKSRFTPSEDCPVATPDRVDLVQLGVTYSAYRESEEEAKRTGRVGDMHILSYEIMEKVPMLIDELAQYRYGGKR